MPFSQILKELLKNRKLTWKELSEELNIGKNQQKYWETHNSSPDGMTLAKLAVYFGVTTDYLLGLEDKKNIDRSGNVITNSINESPNSTLTINQGLSKQEAELVALFHDFGIEKQHKLLTYAFQLRDE